MLYIQHYERNLLRMQMTQSRHFYYVLHLSFAQNHCIEIRDFLLLINSIIILGSGFFLNGRRGRVSENICFDARCPRSSP